MLKIHKFSVATENDCNYKNSYSKLMPITDPKKVLLDIQFSNEEYSLISYGDIPRSMNNHWFGYMKGCKYFLHRSWTGKLCYIFNFEHNDAGVHLSSVLVNINWTGFGDEYGFALNYFKRKIIYNRYYLSGNYEKDLCKEFGTENIMIIQ